MTQKLIQTQEQKLQQLQRLSAQQMLQVKMLEMPLNELEDNINAELDDNPALETENPDDALMGEGLSLIHISEPTRLMATSRMPSSA